MCDQKIYSKLKSIIKARNRVRTLSIFDKEREKFFGVFNYCLSSLKDEYQMILKNSYFDLKYQFWWLDFYCKSTYYRKRYWAINSFVHLFETIYENITDLTVYFSYSV